MLNQPRNSFAGLSSFVLFSCILGISTQTYAATGLVLPSQKPLSLTEGVAPNILVTLDDSGSMGWGFMPDTISAADRTKRAVRSSVYNSMYYNPDIEYAVPKKVTYIGGEIKVTDYIYGNSGDYSFNQAPQDGFLGRSSTSTNLRSQYRFQWGWSGTGVDPVFDSSCPPGISTTDCKKAHYFKYNKSASCPADPVSTNNACYEYVEIDADNEENFATWYSFYRNRNLATRSAANLAFYTLPTNIRITWGALNSCEIGKNVTDSNCSNNKLGRFNNQHRANFFNWISKFPAKGGTPLHTAMHNAGELLRKRQSYQDENGVASACRSNYHVLMTDGAWNGVNRAHLKGDADSISKTLPDGTNYTKSAPYEDTTSDTLADTAFYYWANDLSDLDNNIIPYMPHGNDYWNPRNNPATWQHMVNFMVGLGLTRALTDTSAPAWDADSDVFDTLDQLSSGSKSWPAVGPDNTNNVYDLWHAAVNSRGEFFSADSPQELVDAFSKIMERISGRSTTGSSPAINSSVGDDEAGYSYQASYDSEENWTGNLTAYKHSLNTSTNTIDKKEIWNVQAKNADYWKNWTSRKVYMANATSRKLVDFAWRNLSTEQQAWLNRNSDKGDEVDSLGSQRVNFIRGSRADENGVFRTRTNVLGDIINSKPVTVRGARLLVSYANGIEGKGKKYEDYVTDQKDRKPMVYVGANDGMLHGFNARTGVEMFAFVPSAVIKNLHHLTSTAYGAAKHQFYVDGAIEVSDVYIKGGWRTVLVGTLAAGGQGIYALDVTDPDNIDLLWEFDGSEMDDDVKLGYTYAKPTIAKLHNNKWAVAIGNGYAAEGNNNGKAAFLLIDIENGNLIRQLNVQGTNGVANGLSTPKLADINGDGVADFAYAGDLQGNLWRFDLAPNNGNSDDPFKRPTDASGNPLPGIFSGFKVGFGGTPLFSAQASDGTRQAITAAPSIVRHPSNFGYIVVVGTGRYYAEGDKDGSNTTQSVYGIWDSATHVAQSSSKVGLPFSIIARNRLQQQTLTVQELASSNNQPVRILSNNRIEWAERNSSTGVWTTGGRKAGWYLDFNLSKEMVVADMLQLGRTLYFQTMIPNGDPCASGVENWAYGIDPASGGRTLHHVWIDYRSKTDPNKLYSAIRLDGEGGLSAGYTPTGDYQIHTGGGSANTKLDLQSIGRQNWRMIERDR